MLRAGQYQRNWLDLNQDLSSFWNANERRDSKWELVSHNTHYGIFRTTPKKRAK
jgi:hypothetical protein